MNHGQRLPTMAEATTVRLIGDILNELGYFSDDSIAEIHQENARLQGVIQDPIVEEILQGISKNRTGERGKIEFIIRVDGYGQLIIIFEAKEFTTKHESPSKDIANIDERPKSHISGYAVDGALHYAKKIAAKGYTVIAIAVSGTERDRLRVSSFIHRLGEEYAVPLTYPNQGQTPINEIVDLETYIRSSQYQPQIVMENRSEVAEVVDTVTNLAAPLGNGPLRGLTITSIVAALSSNEDAAVQILEANDFEAKRDVIIGILSEEYTREIIDHVEFEPPEIVGGIVNPEEER